MTARNENRPGYKKTKVGWIPEEWECVTLGDSVRFRSGGTPSKIRTDFWGGPIPWITARDMKSPFLNSSELGITKLGARNGTRLMPENAVFVLVRGMTLLKDVPVALSLCPMAFNQDIKALEPKRGIGLRFCLYLLCARKQQLRGLVDQAGHGTGRLSTDRFASILLPLPPLPEQERIAEVLGAWDRAIGLTDRLIEAKQRLKKGLMQQLLTGRLRFPQFGKPARKHVDLPKGWKMSRIQDIARVNPSTEKPKHENCTVSFFSMADISEEGRIATEQERPYLSVTNGFTSFQDGDILVAKITPCFQNGKGAHVKGLTNGIGFGSTEFHVVRPRKVDERFLFLHTQSRPFRARGEANMIGSAGQKRVPTVFIRKYPIPLPSDEEQRYISLSLYTCDHEIQLLIRKRDRLQEQKRGLMQKLLTGEVRVPVKARKHNVS